tara:strand:+ start:303 stop:476 length:174 start_codon:yes stop_codon:yes gene_type:complete
MQVYVLQDSDKYIRGAFEHRAAAFEAARQEIMLSGPCDDDHLEVVMNEWMVTCVEVE